jgi:hypothetical protein
MDLPEITLALFSLFNVLRLGSYLFVVGAVNALGCTAVVLLTMWKRYVFARRCLQ